MKTASGFLEKKGFRLLSLLVSAALVFQLLLADDIAHGAGEYIFRGYDVENLTSSSFSYIDSTWSNGNIVMTKKTDGQAFGCIEFDDSMNTPIDLGGLEIDFSTTTVVTEEGAAGADNDVPTVSIEFYSSGGSLLKTVTLNKPDNSISGSVMLSSNASVPAGTRTIYVYLTSDNIIEDSDNNVVFQNPSLIIHDAGPPDINVEYDNSWTNSAVTVTVTASDSDSGLEGIYRDGAKVTSESTYTFAASSNSSSDFFSKDYAGKTSETVTAAINNIDKTPPSAPAYLTLSHESWTNTDVSVTVPALGESSGAPEKYIYKLGEDAWKDMPENFSVSENGVFDIRVAVADEAGNTSAELSDTISIDKLPPSINLVTQTVHSGSCVVSVDVSDEGLSGIKTVKYAAGSRDAAWFAAGGTAISDGQFTVSSGGVYTVFVSDNAGNYDLGEYSINTAPSLVDILDMTINEDETVNVPVNASDGETALDALIVRISSSDTDLISEIEKHQTSDAISFDITPTLNQYGGPVTITVEVEDEQGEVVTDSFLVTVSPVNDNPTAQDDTGMTTPEDTSLFIDAAANDTDVDGDALTVSGVGSPGHGLASIVAGRIKYTPALNYCGEDSFAYTVSDGAGGTGTATVYVSVTPVNDAPLAVADEAATSEDTPVDIDVLGNDDDPDLHTGESDAISLLSAQNGAHGVTELADGKVRYTPDTDWFGKDSFTYRITDAEGLQSEATVQVTVTGVPDDPKFIGLSDSYSIPEDSVDAEITFGIHDVETETESLMLQAVSMDDTLLSAMSVEGLGDADDAVTIKVTPEADMFGDVTVNLSLGDGFATVTDSFVLHISNVNDPPVAVADTIEYGEDAGRITILTDTLVGNDTDIDGDELVFVDIASSTTIGVLEPVDESKTAYYYYPADDYEGVDIFTYIVSDGHEQDTGTCRLVAAPANDAPVITIAQETYATDEDVTLSPIVINISDEETNAADLIVKAGSNDSQLISTTGIAVTNNGDGTCSLSITPMPDAYGIATITVSVSDGSTKTTDSFELEVNPVPDAPVAVNDRVYIPISGRQTFSVLLNDHDPDGDDLAVVGSIGVGLDGQLTYNPATKMFVYIAGNGEQGEKTFTYTISDGDETTAESTATVTLDINSVSHTPVITDIGDQYITEDGSTGYLPFSVTDEDIAEYFDISIASSNSALLPEDNEACVDVQEYGDGQYGVRLSPLADMSGESVITITVQDTTGNEASMEFKLYVSPANDAPVAVDDDFTTDEDTPAVLDMLANDSDPENDTIWINNISSPSHGFLSRSGNTYTYTPHTNWNGEETLVYRLSDGQSTVAASVTIHVTPVNDAPIAWDDWLALPNTGGASGVVDVLANDEDPDTGDILKTYQIVTQGQYGTAVIDEETGTITYTRSGASPNDNGEDSVIYRVIDRADATGDYKSDVATIHIGTDFSGTLWCGDRYIECMEDASAFEISLPVHNPGNLDYEVTLGSTTLGTFTDSDNTDNTVLFTPAENQNGSAGITYTVANEGNTLQASGTIHLKIYPVNDPPVIDSAPSSLSCDEDSSGIEFDVDFHDADCLDNELHFYAYAHNASTSAPVPLILSVSYSRGTGTAHVTAVPGVNANGSINIIVGASDGLAETERTIVLTVNPVDDEPIIRDISKSLYEDTSVKFSVVTANSDVDGDDLSVSIGSEDGPEHGAAAVNPDGTITYTPDEDFFGEDELVFSVADDKDGGLVSKRTASLNVLPINDPPVISGLAYYQSTFEDTDKDITLYVTDVDDDMSGASGYSFTSGNEAIVDANDISIIHVSGSEMKLTVKPKANAFGTAVIGITADDGELTAEAAFQLSVIPVNDVPVAADDTATVQEKVGTTAGTTSVTIDVTANDTDVEDTELEVISISGVSAGTVTNNRNGTVTFSIGGDYYGTTTFDYTVSDDNGATDTASVTVTVEPMNDPPRLSNDAVEITEDQVTEIDVLANDNDPDYDELTITNVYGCSESGSVSTDGSKVTYTPGLNFYGSESFSYDVSDGHGGTATASVEVTVKPENDAPEISKHESSSGEWTMQEDTTGAFNFVVSDAETPMVNLIITLNSQDQAKLKNTQMLLSTVSGYKVITVTPEKNANGVIPVQFKVTDGALTTTKIYNITIEAVNDPPEFGSMHNTTPEDTAVSGSVTASDPESDAVTYAKASDPAHGTVTVAPDGSYTYTPNDDYTGEDSFTVTADDGQPEHSTGTGIAHITVTPVNDNPAATDDSDETQEDTAVLIDVLANDIDVDAADGDTLAITAVGSAGHGSAVAVLGKIRYTPVANWNGTDTFSYTISDQEGEKDTATVTVTVTPVNDMPSGGDDVAETNEDTPVIIDVTANDDIDETTNPALEDVKAVRVDDPAHGAAEITPDEKGITYTPDENWFGTETFSYTARDAGGLEADFTVTVEVHSVNDSPVITAPLADISTPEDTLSPEVTFTVSDVEDAAGTMDVSVTHLSGTLLPAITATQDESGNCSFTVMPKLNKNGTAEITVTVTDSGGATDSDTFVLTVTPVNDAPQALDDAASTDENTAKMIDVLANDDVDLPNEGDTLTITSVGATQYGSAVIQVGSNGRQQINYTPNSSRTLKTSYTDTFTYQMKDGSDAVSGAQVTVTVTPVNDAPTISGIDDISGIPEDSADGTGVVGFTVRDEEDDDDTLQISVSSTNTELFPLASITVVNTEGGDGSERTVQAIPAANKFGSSTIRLTVKDEEGLTIYEEFTVSVDSVDDTPMNGDDAFTVVEDVRTQLNVRPNDDVDYITSPDDIEIIGIAQEPQHGTVEIDEDGKFIYYTTYQNSNEEDSFVYSIKDHGGTEGSNEYSFTVLISVTPVNDPPVITYLGDPSYTVNECVPQNDIPFTVTDVDNDTDISDGSVEVSLATASSNPILVRYGVNIDATSGDQRNIDIQPYLKWNGSTTITITATDPGGLTDTESFEFVVLSVNDAPVAINDAFVISEDEQTSLDVLGNDEDDDLDTNPDTERLYVASVTDSDPNAVITVSADEKGVDIDPKPDYNGPVTFNYVTKDAAGLLSNEATVTVTVTQVNDAPVADDDSAVTNEDTPVSIDVLEGDSDVDMTPGLNEHPESEAITISIDEPGLLAPSHGGIEVSDGKIVYTPNTNYNGTDTFEYNADDGEALTRATVTVAISQVNDNPVAVTDNVSTEEDHAVDIFPLDNDTDTDALETLNEDELHLLADLTLVSAEILGTPHGTLEQEGSKLIYTPYANSFDGDVILYEAEDGHGGSDTGAINVSVISVNDLPVFVAVPDDMNLAEDGADGVGSLTVSDVETAGDALTVTVVSSTKPLMVGLGDVTITAGTGGERTVTVNPKDNQNGSAVITLRVTDEDGGYTDCTFTVDVSMINDPPVAMDDTAIISEDSSYAKDWSLLTGEVDIETNDDTLTVDILTEAEHGTAAVDGDNITYVPDADWNGVDSFVYKVTDDLGLFDTGTITITVQQVNDAPVADDDSAMTNEDTPVLIDVLSGDTDIDQKPGLNANPLAEVLFISIDEPDLLAPTHGSITVDDGEILYTPYENYNGSDTFEYNADDGEATDKATVTVTIRQVNDDPTAVTDYAETADEIPVSVNVLENDTDIDTEADLNEDERHSLDTLSVESCAFEGEAFGTLLLEDGIITFTPGPGFPGVQLISYVLLDGHGGSSTGYLSIEEDGENDAPEARDDLITTEEDTPVTFNVLSNDRDRDPGDTLSFVMFTDSTDSLPGTFSTEDDGTVVYTPEANYHGSFTLGYQMCDAEGLTDIAEITFTVTAVNDKPSAEDDTVTTPEDTALNIDVSGLISDPDIATDDDSLTVSVEEGDGPEHGDVTVTGSTIKYTPDANWNGQEILSYTVADEAGEKDAGTITVNVTPVNDAPSAAADTVSINEDSSVLVHVLNNDTDVDMNAALNASVQEPLSVETVIQQPAHGTAEPEEDGIRYTPADDFNGTDSFTYRATDGNYGSVATVSVTVRQVNDNPLAAGDSASTTDGDEVLIDVLANDTDIDTDALLNLDELHSRSGFMVTSAGTPSHGTVAIKNGKISYLPGATFAGTDSFAYTMADGHGGSGTAIVNVTVSSANDPPDVPVVHTPANGQRYGGAATINVMWSGFDIDGDLLTYTLQYFDGSVWRPVASNLLVTTNEFTIPSTLASITSLQFRVSASDAEFTSDYGYSGRVSVDKDIPKDVVVTMKTADGRGYTAGTWTNQNVIVTAVSVKDASAVSFRYALEDKAFATGANKTVTNGVHNVFIEAKDEFGNKAEFGGYLARIDKQVPAVPDSVVSVTGGKAAIRLSLLADPGSSGNRTMTMPDGTKATLTGLQETIWTASQNGTYAFSLSDTAGNTTEFSVAVSELDETPPEISCESAPYVIGETSADVITAALSFSDDMSEITAKGFAVSTDSQYSGVYASYTESITLADPGTYYIHAMAQNAFGLTARKTFGPFIVAGAEPVPSVGDDTPEPVKGDVVMDPKEITGDGKQIRLPGGEWTDSLVLEDIAPGTYLVEIIDEEGNIQVVEVTITDEAIAAGRWQPHDKAGVSWLLWAGIGLALLLLLLLVLCRNTVIDICTIDDSGREKVLRTMRWLKRRKDTVYVDLRNRHVLNAEYGRLTLTKAFTKRMKGKAVIIRLEGDVVLDAEVPEDIRGRFEAMIDRWR